MMEGIKDYIANVVPGEGAVARWDSGVMLVGGDRTAGLDLIARVQGELGPDPEAGAMIGLLVGDGPVIGGEVDLVAAIGTATGVRVIVRGGAQVRTETNEVIVAGASAEIRDLEAPMALWLGLSDPPTVQGHPAKNLRLGVVNGVGVVLYLAPEPAPGEAPAAASDVATGADQVAAVERVAQLDQVAEPSAPTPPAPPELPVAQQDFQAIDWNEAEPVETRTPLAIQDNTVDRPADAAASTGEQVLGIRCSREHFNNPKAGYCQVCGISMVHLTHRLEPGPRPTLGFMVFADGATYAVDRQYLIGRSPEPRPGGGVTPLQTQDATQSVSREHAELRLDGWDAYYVDLGSTNGSFLWDAAGRRWDPIRPNTPVELTSGTTVSVGRMTFVFEGASRAIESP